MPLLILAALVVIYLILGMLYESFIHPLTILSTLPSAGVGALLMLMIFGFELSVIGIIGIILLIGIVKKNGIMMVDFAIAAERERGLSPEASIKEAGAAPVPAHPDDDNGGAARRPAAHARRRHGIGASPAARLCDGGRARLQPGDDALHHAVIYIYLDKLQSWLSRHKPQAEVESEAVVALPKAAE